MSKKTVNSILISLGFVFNIFIFAPLEFYYLNIVDLWFPIKFVLPTIIALSIISFVILFLLTNQLTERKRRVVARLVFGIFIGLYIQGNFLNLGYGQMSTADVQWKMMIRKGIINTIIWIIILAIPFLIKDDKKFNIVSSVISILIILIEIATLMVVISFMHESKNFYLDQSKILEMSEDENIVFLMIDSVESNYVTDVLEEYPEYREYFKDFTFFDNCTGASVLTYMSMPTILTGKDLEVGKNLNENISNCLDDNQLYDILDEYGYKVEWYTDLALVPNTDESQIISNKVNSSLNIKLKDKLKISNLLYDCILYKYLPHFLKYGFNIDSNDFNKVTATGVDPYFEDQVKLYHNITTNGATSNSKEKTFKVIETDGCHYPFTVTRDLEYDLSQEYQNKSLEERQKEEIIASLNLVKAYIDSLKEAGVYDNTTVIIAADHGFENRYNPCLMIKRNNEQNDTIKINSAPVSMNEDYIPTLLNIITNSKDYGKDFYDYEEGEERERIVNSYYFARDSKRNIYVESNVKMATNGDAKDLENYYILDEVFPDVGSLEKKYSFGKKIKLNNNGSSNCMITNGLLRRLGDNADEGNTMGHKCKFVINNKNTNKDIKATLKIGKVYNHQQMIIKVGEHILYERKFSEKDGKSSITFMIPKEIWNTEGNLEIDFEFPDAKTYSEEDEYLRYGTDWVIRAFLFESIKFED